ncbi:MAG: molecular chaperone HscB [Verrucomicrobiota bacterium]|jgi:curved DNA-binding protein CbpA
MIDYFALLEQPRRPWLDEAALKEKFHQLARTSHPDTQSARSTITSRDFAQLSEAFRVLSDPKLRLKHLLQLERNTPASGENVLPKDLEALFPMMNAVMQVADDFQKKKTATTSNALTRSLLKTELLHLQRQIEELREKLSTLHDQTICELRKIDNMWETERSTNLSQLSDIYVRITYLSRWIAQLEEKKLRLSFS